jgi:hypothetical protein
VVIVFTKYDEKEDAARRVLLGSGAESLDAARESWWLGLRTAEQEHYEPGDESNYRHGFEAALRPSMRGKPYEQVLEELRRHYPDASEASFRRGYERGQVHFDSV